MTTRDTHTAFLEAEIKRLRAEITLLKDGHAAVVRSYEATIADLTGALTRISEVQIGPPTITDHDWMARLMQNIALDALAGAKGGQT